MSTFDELHLWGVTVIQSVQAVFKGHSELVLFCSHLGDPRNACLVYFPIAFTLSKSVGIRVMWVSVLAEWINAVLKWVLYGQRPYWWVHETTLYDTAPPIEQFRLTCETGPGSPSGHAMVTGAVLYVMVTAMIKHGKQQNCGSWLSVVSWLFFLLILIPVNIARLYLSAHFPHQVIAGTLAGMLLAELCSRVQLDDLSLRPYFIFSLMIILSGPALYWTMEALGLDPLWTFTLAKKWCAKPEWIHLDTSLFFALTRNASSLSGMGVALYKIEKNGNLPSDKTLPAQIIAIILSIILTRGGEYVMISHNYTVAFYTMGFVKYFMLPYVIVVYIDVHVPRIVDWILSGGRIRRDS